MKVFTDEVRAGLAELVTVADTIYVGPIKESALCIQDNEGFEVAIERNRFGQASAMICVTTEATPEQQLHLAAALSTFINRCRYVLDWKEGKEPEIDVPELSVEELREEIARMDNFNPVLPEEAKAELAESIKRKQKELIEAYSAGVQNAQAPDGTPLHPACGGDIV